MKGSLVLTCTSCERLHILDKIGDVAPRTYVLQVAGKGEAP
jgi:hypothetical protein